MVKELREFIKWLRGEEEASTPDEAAVSSLVKLVALSSMANIYEARRREEEQQYSQAVPDSDDAGIPGEGGNI